MPFVFYNYNASLAFVECFDHIEDLSKIDWPLFFETPKLGGIANIGKACTTMPDMHEGWKPGRPSFSYTIGCRWNSSLESERRTNRPEPRSNRLPERVGQQCR